MPGAQKDITPANSIYRTRFYSDCLGVFQGGGCRAAAFAGAYDAAYQLGVRFSEVAGTSAGSIVAALIAAGGAPEFVLRELSQLSFAEFLRPPKRRLFNSRIARSLEPIAKRVGSEAAVMFCAALSGGTHSSEAIADWVDEKLRTLLGVNKGPVRFCDLQIPLYVVASDLTTMKPRVWSNRETPTMSVAHAVRASCSIPLFYQPVEEGSTLLVDGGLVSNLPSFVFTPRGGSEPFTGRRMLSFVLDADQSTARPQTPSEYLRKLVSLVVDGSTDVQLRFQPDLAKIVIPTGSIQATDFETMDTSKVERLIENGRRAADSFIRRELLAARAESARNRLPVISHCLLWARGASDSMRSHSQHRRAVAITGIDQWVQTFRHDWKQAGTVQATHFGTLGSLTHYDPTTHVHSALTRLCQTVGACSPLSGPGLTGAGFCR